MNPTSHGFCVPWLFDTRWARRDWLRTHRNRMTKRQKGTRVWKRAHGIGASR